jgi:hypothetical protein
VENCHVAQTTIMPVLDTGILFLVWQEDTRVKPGYDEFSELRLPDLRGEPSRSTAL